MAKSELEYLRGLSKALTTQCATLTTQARSVATQIDSINTRIAELESAAPVPVDTSGIGTYAQAVAAYLSTAAAPPRKVTQAGIVSVACAELGLDRSALRAPLSVADWAALGDVIIANGYLPDGVSDTRYVRRK